jgi:hypothetical protein
MHHRRPSASTHIGRIRGRRRRAHVSIPDIYRSNRINQLAVSWCRHRIAAASLVAFDRGKPREEESFDDFAGRICDCCATVDINGCRQCSGRTEAKSVLVA